MKKKHMPKGFRAKPDHDPKVAVAFDNDLFEKIKAMAEKENLTFGAMVCELCEVGIIDLEDADQHEPHAA
jgi:hypothetical protein